LITIVPEESFEKRLSCGYEYEDCPGEEGKIEAPETDPVFDVPLAATELLVGTQSSVSPLTCSGI